MGSGGACPVAFCPGDEATYTCDVGAMSQVGNTKWSFSEGSCNNNHIILKRKAESDTDCASSKSVCGAFNATNSDPGAGQPCTVSMVTVDLSNVTNGTIIRCLNVDDSTSTEVGSAAILKGQSAYCRS